MKTQTPFQPLIHQLPTGLMPPTRMNNPFCYEPDALCQMALDEVWRSLSADTWPQAFRDDIARGKMFGVLIVETADTQTDTHQRLGYLAAFSGQTGGSFCWPGFVPPIVDYLQPDGYFKTREHAISNMKHLIHEQKAACGKELARRQAALNDLRRQAKTDTENYRALMKAAKERRHALRGDMAEEAALIRESQHQHAELRRMKQRYKTLIDEAKRQTEAIAGPIRRLQAEREQQSQALQRWLFDQYVLINGRGERLPMERLFASVPPSGAGDCCEPKLLQYAYAHGLRPRCMAMRWWGESPKEEVRHDGQYYPACNRRCKPILSWMLQGLDVDDNPLDSDYHTTALRIIYEDDNICIVDKPAGMLSVPGKSQRESVLSMMRRHCPNADSPLIVHRLDMDTSGLMVVAKTQKAYRNLQEQFLRHEVRKRYESLHALPADCPLPFSESGTIDLPLRPDLDDRPRQLVDNQYGRTATTEYRVAERKGDRLRLSLWPHTGRTHQLRVHCAHHDGLNLPILGDRLYGLPGPRLCLHAAELTFRHPVLGRLMTFHSKPDF